MKNRVGKVYFCDICGNEVEFIKDGGAPIICCGEPMKEKENAEK